MPFPCCSPLLSSTLAYKNTVCYAGDTNKRGNPATYNNDIILLRTTKSHCDDIESGNVVRVSNRFTKIHTLACQSYTHTHMNRCMCNIILYRLTSAICQKSPVHFQCNDLAFSLSAKSQGVTTYTYTQAYIYVHMYK